MLSTRHHPCHKLSVTVSLVLTLFSSFEELHALSQLYYLRLVCMLKLFLVFILGQFIVNIVPLRTQYIRILLICMQSLLALLTGECWTIVLDFAVARF